MIGSHLDGEKSMQRRSCTVCVRTCFGYSQNIEAGRVWSGEHVTVHGKPDHGGNEREGQRFSELPEFSQDRIAAGLYTHNIVTCPPTHGDILHAELANHKFKWGEIQQQFAVISASGC